MTKLNYIILEDGKKRPKIGEKSWVYTTKKYRGNKGLLTGKTNGVTVIDIDLHGKKKRGEVGNKSLMHHKPTLDWLNEGYNDLLFATKTIVTASHNYHHYFKWCDLPNSNLRSYGLEIDIKNSERSYVVAEGSIVTNSEGYDVEYEEFNEEGIIEMPPKLYEFFKTLVNQKKIHKVKCPRRKITADIPDTLKNYNITRKWMDDNGKICYDLDKSPMGRNCPFVGRCHNDNNCFFEYDPITKCTYHRCWKCLNKRKIFGSGSGGFKDLVDRFNANTINTNCSRFFINLIQGKCYYHQREWYSINSVGLIEKGTEDGVIKNKLEELIDSVSIYQLAETDEDKKKVINKLLKHFDMKKSGIVKDCKDACEFYKLQNKLDMNRFLIGFDNGVFDIRNGLLRDGTVEDLVSMTTGYDYNPQSDPEIRNEVIRYFTQLYPDDEVRDYVLTNIYGHCLAGENTENIFPIYDGYGGNGKSVEVSFMKKVLGDYCTTLPSQALNSVRGDGSGANSSLFKAVKSLLTVVSEPTYLDTNQVKKLSGGDEICVRDLYKSSIELIPKFVLIVLMNSANDIKIKDNSNASKRRVKVIPHISKFKSKEDIGNHIYKKDVGIGRNFDRWKNEMFLMMYDRCYKDVGVPLAVKEKSKRFMEDDSVLDLFIDDHIKWGGINYVGGFTLEELKTTFYEWFGKANENGEFGMKNYKLAEVKKKVQSHCNMDFKRGYVDGKQYKNVLFGFTLKSLKVLKGTCLIET